MARPQISPYGSWRSPVTADAIVAGVIGLSQIQLDGDDIYWVEGRPAEAGRNVIVRRRPDGSTTDITPPEYNARTRVHEYGGGAYLVRDGVVWFTNFKDQRLYRQDPGRPPVAITPAQDIRHADIVFDQRHQRLIAVREDHTTDMPSAVNTIVSLDPTGKIPAKTLVQANDFYSSPRVSPSGTHLSWLTWNHPNMPWDGTELWVAELTPDGLRALRKVAGGEGESIFQPTWSPDGMLYFVSDRSNWWNLYRWRGPTVEPVAEVPAELGTAQWTFGMSTYAFESERRIACQVRSQGVTRLATVDLQAGRREPVDTPFTAFSPYIQARAGKAYTIAGSPTETMSVVAVNLETAFLVSQAAIPALLERGGGAIVNFASVAVLKPQRHMASYSAAKAAVAGLTRALARELADRRVRVNAVAPGMVKTAANLAQVKDAKVHWVELDHVVNAVLFLASDAAGAVTGEILPVAGDV